MVQLDKRGLKPGSDRQNSSGVRELSRGRKGVLTHREGKWLLFLGDVLALGGPAIAATLQRHTERPISLGSLELVVILGSAALWMVLAMSLNLYSLARASSLSRTHRATLCAILLVIAARSLYQGRLHAGIVDDSMFAAVAVFALGTWRTLFALAAKVVPFTKRVLVIGAGVSGGILAQEFHEKNRRGEQDYQMVGFIDDDPEKIGKVHVGMPVIGTGKEVPELIDLHQIDTICLSVNRVSVISAEVFESLVTARERGVRILSMPALYETLTSKVAVEHVGDNWGIMFPMEHYRSPFVHDVMVRVVDLVAGVVGLAVTALVSPVLLLVNKFGGSPGPLFYSQMRVGKGGKEFRIYKFRSMVTNAEAAGAKWCVEDDPRITKVGNFLRKTRIDELPQFWNVLIGEMSLIGPRPERPEFTKLLAESIPFFRARHAVKPGLTGWAQVMYRYGSSEEDSLIKLQYDLYYIKHRSPAIDLRIIAKSFKVILQAAGR